MRKRFDCIIVLGGGVTKGGRCPIRVKQRLDKALELYNKKFADKILLSGKASKTLFNDNFNEARIMQKYLLEKGFPKNRIVLEDKSQDTFENAYYSKLIFEKNNYKRIILVTNEFHMKRAKKIFKFIFGKGYKFYFKSAKNGDLNKEELKKRMLFEKELLKLIKKEVFKKNKKGDSEGIKNFLNDSERFKKMDNELSLKLKDYKKLY